VILSKYIYALAHEEEEEEEEEEEDGPVQPS